ncbi:MAG: OmpP1/FadL family transporter [Myxococcaceae bacterium]
MRHLFSAALLFVSSAALAGGFVVAEQDAAAIGRSGTAIASAQNASSIHYNPAGLIGPRGVFATAGFTAIAPSVSATDPSSGQVSKASGGIKTPPYAYVGYGMDKLSLGLGFNAPFGGGLKWDDDWRGRFQLTSMELQVLAGHAGAAYQVTPQISLGATVSVFNASVALTKHTDFVDSEGTAQVGGSGTGIGGALGINIQPRREVKIGIVGKLPTTVPITGRAHFQDVPPDYGNMLQDQGMKSSVTLPGKIGLGVQTDTQWARFYADAELTFWSSFKSFDVSFDKTTDLNQSEPRNWQNSPTFRLGAERDIANTTVRAGAMYDSSASPSNTISPSLPDSTRIGFSLGVGHDLGPVHGDAAYQFISFLPREATGEAFAAKYSASAHMLAISISFKQEQPRSKAIEEEDPIAPAPLVDAVSQR